MALQDVGVRLIADGASSFNRQLDTATRGVNDFGREAGTAGRGLDVLTVAVGSFLGNLALDMLYKATEAVIGFGAGSVTAAGDFEASLNRFSSVTGDSVEAAGMEIEDFSELFLQMGADTQFSAQQAADAAVELAKGGVDVATIAAGGLEAALGLAAAGEIELTTAGEILAKQLGVWSDEGVTAIEVTDLLAQAANASTVGVDDLALGLANAGGVAKGVGASYEDTVTALALLAPGFSSASDAGTALKTFFNSLIPTTKNQTDAMMELGLFTAETGSAFYDAEGNFIGVAEAGQLLQDATADLTKEQRSLALEMIFGQDAQRAALRLADAGAEGFNGMAASMDAAGSAAEQAAERNKGFNFAMESLRGSVETAQIQIGTVLLPILTDLTTSFTGLVNEYGPAIAAFLAATLPAAIATASSFFTTTLLPAIQALPGVLSTIIETGQGVITWIQGLIGTFTTFHSAGLNPLQAAFATVIEVFDLTGAQAGAMGQALDVVKGVVAAVVSVVGPAIASLGTHGEELRAAWDAVAPILGALFLGLQAVAVGVLNGIALAIGPLLQAIAGMATGITDTFGGIVDYFTSALDFIKALFSGDTEAMIQSWREMQVAMQDIAKGLWDTVEATFIGALTVIGALIGGFIQGVVEFFITLYNELVGGSIILDLVEDTIEAFTILKDDVLEVIGQMISDFLLDIAEFVVDTVQYFVDLGTDVLTTLNTMATDALTAAQGIGNSIISGITGILGGAAGVLWDALSGALGGMWDSANAWLENLSPSHRAADELGQPIIAGIARGILDNANLATAAMQTSLAATFKEGVSLVSPPAGMAQLAGMTSNTYHNQTVNFTGNYASAPAVTDQRDLLWTLGTAGN